MFFTCLEVSKHSTVSLVYTGYKYNLLSNKCFFFIYRVIPSGYLGLLALHLSGTPSQRTGTIPQLFTPQQPSIFKKPRYIYLACYPSPSDLFPRLEVYTWFRKYYIKLKNKQSNRKCWILHELTKFQEFHNAIYFVSIAFNYWALQIWCSYPFQVWWGFFLQEPKLRL